jgi:hypothetical protein
MEYGPRPRPIFLGLALVTVGVLFLLREVGVLPDIHLWTLVWLGLGGWLFVGTLAGNRQGWFWPLVLLAVGGFLLARDLGALPGGFQIWPVVVIAIGLAVLAETLTHRPGDKPKGPSSPDL